MQKAAENSRPMSSGKGGKRISVFDRLGPGNDEAPPPTHRRYSSEKHSDKGRHLHPHVRGEDPPRERKPSHQDFEDKKHLHYREVPPHPPPPLPPPQLPPPPSSRPRHRHFHGTPESEYSEEEGGRRPTPRKPRETQEAVVMGDGYPPKLRVPPDDRGDRSSKATRGGGVRVKRRRGEGAVGRSSSESSLESEVGSGEEGKRRRGNHHREAEKRPRHSLESGKLPDEGGRRLPEEGGRRLPDEGGRRLPDEGGRRLPDEGGRRLPDEGGRRLPDEGGRRLPDEGGRRLPDEGGRRLPDEGGRRQPDEGGRRLPDEGGRRLPDEGGRRLPDEGGRRLPDEGGRRLPDEGGRRLPDEGGRRLPDEGGRRLPDEGGRRLPKHLERKEKGNERHTHLERVSSGGLPLSSGISGGGELKGLKPAGEGKEEREGLGHHKRRREEEYLEPRHLERKRKREHIDDEFPPPETKKPRMSMGDHMPMKEAERQRSREGEEKYAGRMREMEGGERKRRYEGREPLARKHQHPQGLGMGGRRHSRPQVTSPGGGGGKRGEHHYSRKERKPEGAEPFDSLSETDSIGDEMTATAPRKKLDWSSLSTLTLAAKPRKVSTSALERFTPGVLLAQTGTSPLLAGPELYRKVSGVVSNHLRREQQSSNSETLSESVLENPFGFTESARAGVSRLEQHQEVGHVFTDIGPCRRALTASVDFAMRRKLRKNNNRDFLPSSHPSANWDSEHYSASLALYQSLGTKASGKPAFRLHQSRVGTVLIAR